MIPEYKISNYDKMKDSMADVFLQYNQEEIISCLLYTSLPI